MKLTTLVSMGLLALLLVLAGFWLGISVDSKDGFSNSGKRRSNLDEAVHFFVSGDTRKAIEAAEIHCHAYPEHSEGKLFLARLYVEAGTLQKADAVLKELGERKHNPVAIALLQAAIARKTGSAEKAEMALHGALKDSPNDPRLWRELGLLMNERGQGQEALTYIHKSLQLDPSQEDLNTLSQNIAMGKFSPGMPSNPTGTRFDPQELMPNPNPTNNPRSPAPFGPRHQEPQPWGSR
jgi:predicted Zn-dependent protease